MSQTIKIHIIVYLFIIMWAYEMSNTPEYDFICSNNSIEMKLAKEYYHWDKLDKADSYYFTDTIIKFYNFLIKNKHRLKEK